MCELENATLRKASTLCLSSYIDIKSGLIEYYLGDILREQRIYVYKYLLWLFIMERAKLFVCLLLLCKQLLSNMCNIYQVIIHQALFKYISSNNWVLMKKTYTVSTIDIIILTFIGEKTMSLSLFS